MAISPKRRRTEEQVDVHFTLKRVFKKSSFRPLQLQVINAAISGHDVFLCAATSFGKSLCYQLPAVVATGVTVVISPLLALMTNQVHAARSLGIPCEVICSNTNVAERTRIENDLLCGHPQTRLLYVTPELCSFDRFRSTLQKIHRQGQLTRIAIDEAHCISEWGHDFRPAYKELVWLKRNLILPSVPIMAVTATATKKVRDDIFTFLGLKDALAFSTSSARPNIHYEVQYFSESSPKNLEGDLYPYLLQWLKQIHNRRLVALHANPSNPTFTTPTHGIIYCPTRNLADELASRLSQSGMRAAAYHAGLDTPTRQAVQAAFLSSSSPTTTGNNPRALFASFNLICATTAFGMGIDMPTVRLVVHYGLPRGMESFAQESGRAGRDNRAARSLVLYTREERDRALWKAGLDVAREEAQRAQQQKGGGAGGKAATAKLHSLKAVIRYCEQVDRCRHRVLSEYFAVASAKTGTTTATKQPNGGEAQLHPGREMAVHRGENTDQATSAPPRKRKADAADTDDQQEEEEEEDIQCDFACDVCKDGPARLRERKDRALASDEDAMLFTQRESESAAAQPPLGTYDYDCM